MSRETRARLFGHLAAVMAARLCALGFGGAAVVALFIKGAAPAAALGFAAWLFWQAAPAPTDALDRATGRR